jgi:hypothetical protein
LVVCGGNDFSVWLEGKDLFMMQILKVREKTKNIGGNQHNDVTARCNFSRWKS